MQTYFIVEIQSYNDGRASIPDPLGFQVSDVAGENAMIARFFNVCAIAAESSVDTHVVQIIDSEGNVWRGMKQIFRHGHEDE